MASRNLRQTSARTWPDPFAVGLHGPALGICDNCLSRRIVLGKSPSIYLSRRSPALSCRPSRPGESHPEALTDPCLSLSTHTARVIHEGLPPFATISRFLPLPVDQRDRDANDLPPSLHGHYSASSLLQGSPPLNSASVLSPSWFFHLWLFRLHRSLRFPRSVQLPHGQAGSKRNVVSDRGQEDLCWIGL